MQGLLARTMVLAVLAGSSVSAWSQTAARVETMPLELKSSERYTITVALEPGRLVRLVAPDDAVLRLVAAPIGATVKQTQEVIRLDSAEPDARLKIAEAHHRLKEAASKAAKGSEIAAAEVAVAKAEVDLARLHVDRRTLRAPFDGQVLAAPIDPGQFVTKGQTVAEFGDVSHLRALVPVDRASVQVGGDLPLVVEGRSVNAKVRAVVALPESFAALRELAASFAAAWVEVDNARGEWQPGLRVRAPGTPTGPIAGVPSVALHADPSRAGGIAQVIRADYVTDVPVQVLGELAPDRVQVSGAFRPGDLLIVSTSVPLAARTFIRFGGEGAEQGTGSVAQVAPPAPPSVTMTPGNPVVAPIGSPGGVQPATKAAARPGPAPSTTARPNPTGPATKAGTPAKAATKGTIDPF